jgi:hypothetical protein
MFATGGLMRTLAVVKTEFDGLHCWKNCPIPEVDFLGKEHRHKFYVTVKIDVKHHDREVEFFMVKADINRAIVELFPTTLNGIRLLGSRSCEMMAKEIGDHLGHRVGYEVTFVSVYEDNENGAEVEYA